MRDGAELASHGRGPSPTRHPGPSGGRFWVEGEGEIVLAGERAHVGHAIGIGAFLLVPRRILANLGHNFRDEFPDSAGLAEITAAGRSTCRCSRS